MHFSLIKIPRSSARRSTFNVEFLTDDLALLLEKADYDDEGSFSKYFLSLIDFDWFSKTARKLHTLEFEDLEHRIECLDVYVDAEDPSRFVLERTRGDQSTWLKRGQIVGDKIVFGEEVRWESDRGGYVLVSLVGSKLYSFHERVFGQPNEVSFID